MKTLAIDEYGKAELMERKWGLHPSIGQKIASLIIFAGSIEYYLERAIWRVRNIDPKGIRPETDAKMIADLIAMLETFAQSLPSDDERTLLQTWCNATRSAFIIRHNIAHGVAVNVGTLAFMRNPRWHGETRKREFGDFWADDNTVDLVRGSFATLLRVIAQVEAGNALMEIATPLALRALREAQSLLGEFSSQVYNPSFEKY
jgi:hypothetical protein